MGALNFDFDAMVADADEAESRGSKFSKLAGVGSVGRPDEERGAEFSKLAGLARADPRCPPRLEAQNGQRTRAKHANLLKCPGKATGASDVASATQDGGRADDALPLIGKWSEGFAALDPDKPTDGFHERDWRELCHDGALFLAGWARQAAKLGWSTIDVFGVHRTAPAANYAAMGLVPLLRGGVVAALTADSASVQRPTGGRLTFYRQPPQRDAVPIWKLVREQCLAGNKAHSTQRDHGSAGDV